MDYRMRNDLNRQVLPGRIIENVVGVNGPIGSERMTVGFATYSAEAGRMEPHNHAEETIYVGSSDRGWVRYGGRPEALQHKLALEAGMVLHFDALEWHVFEYDEGGSVEIVFIYGQVDNIRPEEILQSGGKQ